MPPKTGSRTSGAGAPAASASSASEGRQSRLNLTRRADFGSVLSRSDDSDLVVVGVDIPSADQSAAPRLAATPAAPLDTARPASVPSRLPRRPSAIIPPSDGPAAQRPVGPVVPEAAPAFYFARWLQTDSARTPVASSTATPAATSVARSDSDGGIDHTPTPATAAPLNQNSLTLSRSDTLPIANPLPASASHSRVRLAPYRVSPPPPPPQQPTHRTSSSASGPTLKTAALAREPSVTVSHGGEKFELPRRVVALARAANRAAAAKAAAEAAAAGVPWVASPVPATPSTGATPAPASPPLMSSAKGDISDDDDADVTVAFPVASRASSPGISPVRPAAAPRRPSASPRRGAGASPRRSPRALHRFQGTSTAVVIGALGAASLASNAGPRAAPTLSQHAVRREPSVAHIVVPPRPAPLPVPPMVPTPSAGTGVRTGGPTPLVRGAAASFFVANGAQQPPSVASLRLVSDRGTDSCRDSDATKEDDAVIEDFGGQPGLLMTVSGILAASQSLPAEALSGWDGACTPSDQPVRLRSEFEVAEELQNQRELRAIRQVNSPPPALPAARAARLVEPDRLAPPRGARAAAGPMSLRVAPQSPGKLRPALQRSLHTSGETKRIRVGAAAFDSDSDNEAGGPGGPAPIAANTAHNFGNGVRSAFATDSIHGAAPLRDTKSLDDGDEELVSGIEVARGLHLVFSQHAATTALSFNTVSSSGNSAFTGPTLPALLTQSQGRGEGEDATDGTGRSQAPSRGPKRSAASPTCQLPPRRNGARAGAPVSPAAQGKRARRAGAPTQAAVSFDDDADDDDRSPLTAADCVPISAVRAAAPPPLPAVAGISSRRLRRGISSLSVVAPALPAPSARAAAAAREWTSCPFTHAAVATRELAAAIATSALAAHPLSDSSPPVPQDAISPDAPDTLRALLAPPARTALPDGPTLLGSALLPLSSERFRGRFGDVTKVVSAGGGRVWAVKRLRRTVAQKSQLDRALAEAQLVARLHEPLSPLWLPPEHSARPPRLLPQAASWGSLRALVAHSILSALPAGAAGAAAEKLMPSVAGRRVATAPSSNHLAARIAELPPAAAEAATEVLSRDKLFVSTEDDEHLSSALATTSSAPHTSPLPSPSALVTALLPSAAVVAGPERVAAAAAGVLVPGPVWASDRELYMAFGWCDGGALSSPLKTYWKYAAQRWQEHYSALDAAADFAAAPALSPDCAPVDAPPPPPPFACPFTVLVAAHAIAAALSRAHDRGIAHLDVKPENILLERSGDASSLRLGDFGLARPFDPFAIGSQAESEAATVTAVTGTVAHAVDVAGAAGALAWVGARARLPQPVSSAFTTVLVEGARLPPPASADAGLLPPPVAFSAAAPRRGGERAPRSPASTTEGAWGDSEGDKRYLSAEGLEPALWRSEWAASVRESAAAPPTPLDRVDLFAFGCTLLEIYTGAPLPNEGQAYSALRCGALVRVPPLHTTHVNARPQAPVPGPMILPRPPAPADAASADASEASLPPLSSDLVRARFCICCRAESSEAPASSSTDEETPYLCSLRPVVSALVASAAASAGVRITATGAGVLGRAAARSINVHLAVHCRRLIASLMHPRVLSRPAAADVAWDVARTLCFSVGAVEAELAKALREPALAQALTPGASGSVSLVAVRLEPRFARALASTLQSTLTSMPDITRRDSITSATEEDHAGFSATEPVVSQSGASLTATLGFTSCRATDAAPHSACASPSRAETHHPPAARRESQRTRDAVSSHASPRRPSHTPSRRQRDGQQAPQTRHSGRAGVTPEVRLARDAAATPHMAQFRAAAQAGMPQKERRSLLLSQSSDVNTEAW